MRRAAVARWLGVTVALWPVTRVAGQRAPSEVAVPAVAATVWGTVFDSVGGRPLAGALVQLTARDSASQGRVFSARSDSAGKYRLGDVPAGSYVAGFFHPALDSLGLESDDEVVDVGAIDLQVNFAIPSPHTLHDAICPQSAGDSSAVLFGHVHATEGGAAMVGATISAAFLQLDAGAPFLSPRQRRLSASAVDEGWFAICGIPAATAVTVVASMANDSSGLVQVDVPAGTARHLALTVGGAHRVVLRDSTSEARGGVRTVWRGDATLRGVVRDSAGRPVRDAGVAVWGTERRVTTGRHGDFLLDSLPGGTQMLEVRAVGYEPVQQPVQLAAGWPRTRDVTLRRRVVALPTVAVTGAAAQKRAKLVRFYERKELAARGINYGHFLTTEDIERKHVPWFSDLVKDIPGIHVYHRIYPEDDEIGGSQLMRPPNLYCRMTIYLDGIRVTNQLNGGDPDPINLLVSPSSVAGVEVYPYPNGVPPEYQSLNGKCGVILIWTK